MNFLGIVTIRHLRSRATPLAVAIILFPVIANTQTITLGEAVDNTSLTWITGGDANWFGQTAVYYYDGDAAQSGDLAFNQVSWIQTTATGPGILSFYWKASSLIATTSLKFYVDDVLVFTNVDYQQWRLKTYLVSAGTHTLRWTYTQVLQSEAGFLDKVGFIKDPAVMVTSPNGGETWYQRDSHDIQWTSTENAGANVKIELYQGGDLSDSIATTTANDGHYEWFVPTSLTPGTDYHIKITSASASSIYDDSDSSFSIAASPQASFSGFLVLSDSDDYAETPDNAELDVGDESTESLTIEAWVYIQTTSLNRLSAVNKPQSYELYARRYSTDRTYGCIGYFLTPPTGSTQGVERCEWPAYGYGWHHVAVVLDKSTGQARFYMDGAAFSDPYSFTSSINNSTAGLKVGSTSSGVSGALDEIRISDLARYTGATYDVPMAPFTCDQNTRALWHFDESEGATIFHDACGTIDNVLTGYNGAHTEGVPAYRNYLPLILKWFGMLRLTGR